MKRTVRIHYYLAAILIAVFPTISYAQSSGNELLKQCSAVARYQEGNETKDLKDALGGMFCLGLVQGVTNTNKLYQALDKEKALFCAPDSINNGQGARIVLKYLNDHPEMLHLNDSLLVISAMQKAFPCPQQ